MSIYPSLEDMKVDQMCRAQAQSSLNHFSPPPYSSPSAPVPKNNALTTYPSLGNFMGLELSEDVIKQNMPEYLSVQLQQSIVPVGGITMVAPVSGQTVGLKRAQVTNGIREVILCKDKDHKIGLRVKEINKGVFISLVVDKSPAALAGLRFGDQILQINDVNLAGYSMNKVHELLRKCPENGIKMVVRDRPFERSITLHKDSTGNLGFQFKNGKITTIVKDSSAARNGVLIEHYLLEVDGQNVVGLKDKDITEIIKRAGNVVTITVIPAFVYDHMIKSMAGSLLKGLMDHSVPEF